MASWKTDVRIIRKLQWKLIEERVNKEFPTDFVWKWSSMGIWFGP
jgi:hypothetical protein